MSIDFTKIFCCLEGRLNLHLYLDWGAEKKYSKPSTLLCGLSAVKLRIDNIIIKSWNHRVTWAERDLKDH